MSTESCASCGKPIENTTVTGIFCEACHDRDVAPKPGWKSYFTGPTYIGLIAVGFPFFAHANINGLDYVAVGGGAVGLLAGGAGLAVGLKSPKEERGKKLAAAGAVMLVALLVLLRSGLLS